MARSLEFGHSPSRERERDLVLAFQAGHVAAYEKIDRDCRPAAERICRRLLINPADVEEAVQETMVRAYQGLPRFNGSYALKAWVARIATNVCLDTLRARSRRPQTGGTINPDIEVRNGENGNGRQDPEELVEQAADAQEVRKVLSALPERHRTALVLREFEGLSHRRIAEMLDTSPERVKALIHRAKAGFRRAWDDDHPGRLAVFAPLLTPINWIRRMFGRAAELDPGAGSAASAASSPAAQTLATIATERVSVLATVVLAGAVGFTVHHAPSPSRANEEPAVIEIVQAPLQAPEAGSTVAKVEKRAQKKSDTPEPQPAPAPLPVADESTDAEVEEVVLDDPEEIGAPEEPVADPSPEPPPHPQGFGYAFTSDRTADELCGCDAAPTLAEGRVDVSDRGLSQYSATLAGAIQDSAGATGWPVQVEIDASNDRISLYFEIRTSHGTSPYDASGVQGTMTEQPWGGWAYTYSGTYEARGGPAGNADAPQRGSFTAALTFSWAEHRLVWADLDLDERD